jgi:hypothetical protein
MIMENPTMEGLYDIMIRNPHQSVIDLSGATTTTVGSASPTGESGSGRMMKKKA